MKNYDYETLRPQFVALFLLIRLLKTIFDMKTLLSTKFFTTTAGESQEYKFQQPGNKNAQAGFPKGS